MSEQEREKKEVEEVEGSEKSIGPRERIIIWQKPQKRIKELYLSVGERVGGGLHSTPVDCFFRFLTLTDVPVAAAACTAIVVLLAVYVLFVSSAGACPIALFLPSFHPSFHPSFLSSFVPSFPPFFPHPDIFFLTGHLVFFTLFFLFFFFFFTHPHAFF